MRENSSSASFSPWSRVGPTTETKDLFSSRTAYPTPAWPCGPHAQQRQRVPQRGLVPVGAVGDRVERLPEPCCHVLGHPALGEQRGNVGQRQIVVVGPVVLATALPAAVGLGVGQPLEPLQRKLGMIADGWHHALGHQFAVSVEPAVGAAGDRVDRRPRADGAVVMLDDLHVADGQLGKADLTATTPAVGDLEEVDARPVGAVDARGGPPGVGRQRPPTVLGFDHRLVAGLVVVGVLVETDQRGHHADEQVGAAVVLSPPDDLVVVGVDAVVLVSGEPPNRALVARSPGRDHSRPASLTVGEHASRIDGVVLARLTISAGLFGRGLVVICWLGCPRGVVATGAFFMWGTHEGVTASFCGSGGPTARSRT